MDLCRDVFLDGETWQERCLDSNVVCLYQCLNILRLFFQKKIVCPSLTSRYLMDLFIHFYKIFMALLGSLIPQSFKGFDVFCHQQPSIDASPGDTTNRLLSFACCGPIGRSLSLSSVSTHLVILISLRLDLLAIFFSNQFHQECCNLPVTHCGAIFLITQESSR